LGGYVNRKKTIHSSNHSNQTSSEIKERRSHLKEENNIWEQSYESKKPSLSKYLQYISDVRRRTETVQKTKEERN